jgi:cytosine/adenosine deaminase-related metal-dependent hydrolase
MRLISAHYVYTNSGPPLKRPIIATEDDGRIISIETTSGELNERHSLEFYNGIIVPGFVNCHCHIELSWMKGKIPGGTGLGGFLTSLNSMRNNPPEDILQPVSSISKNVLLPFLSVP